jgi:hypothetical protein
MPTPAAARPTATPPPAPLATEDGWSLAAAIGGAGATEWIAIGMVVVGGYLLLSMAIPGIAFGGSILLATGGAVLLWLHFSHRAGAWALYAGAVLTAVGTLRVLGDLMPFTVQGETALGLGIALLAIAYLRHSQAGGYGWQGIVGVVALAWGGLQLVLGLLPGSPGPLDLVVPALIMGGGILLLARTIRSRAT